MAYTGEGLPQGKDCIFYVNTGELPPKSRNELVADYERRFKEKFPEHRVLVVPTKDRATSVEVLPGK